MKTCSQGVTYVRDKKWAELVYLCVQCSFGHVVASFAGCRFLVKHRENRRDLLGVSRRRRRIRDGAGDGSDPLRVGEEVQAAHGSDAGSKGSSQYECMTHAVAQGRTCMRRAAMTMGAAMKIWLKTLLDAVDRWGAARRSKCAIGIQLQ